LKFASEVVSPNECLVGLMRYDDRNEIIRGEGINVSANARIAAALKERTQLTFVNMPLSSGLEYIGALHNIDVDIDQASLKNAAVATTTPVTIDVRSVRLGVALKMWLRPLKLGYVLRDGRLVVTSRQDAATDLPKYVADKDEQQSDVARMIQVQLHKLQALESTRAGLRHAAEGYEQLHSKYRSQLGGLQARFHMGLCLQKLGQTEKASAIFDELLKLPNKPEAIHALKAEVRQQVALNAKSSLPGAAFGLPKSDNSVASAEKDKPLDLIQLATTYVDAVGAMELAQLKMKRLDQLVESGAVTKLDAETARLATKTAERKVALLKAIIEQEIEATIENRKAAESRLKYEQAQFRQGNAKQIPSGSRIRQLDGRLRTLRLILKP
jgi:tetratricopeptide (TPR) repeat protein